MKKRLIVWMLCAGLILTPGCSLFRGGTAKQNAVQALVSTTRTAVALMTVAGIAYDAGAFGEPGSDRAEQTWNRIATQSVQLNQALTAWSEAIRANKDATTYQFAVSQALAVLTALLPATKKQSALTPDELRLGPSNNPGFSESYPAIVRLPPLETLERFGTPDSFRPSYAYVGGSR